jgi:hypothetical protein
MRRKKRAKVNVKRVNLKELYEQLFVRLDKLYENIHRKRKKGRPRKYKESLIYFALAFKVIPKLIKIVYNSIMGRDKLNPYVFYPYIKKIFNVE